MKITKITKEAMDGLRAGDIIEKADGGRLRIKERKLVDNLFFPHSFTFEWFGDSVLSFTEDGRFLPNINKSWHDIVAIEKAPLEIPPGFIPWSGGKCPVGPETEVKVITKASYPSIASCHPSNRWNWDLCSNPIIAYQVSQPKQKGEIWAVVTEAGFNFVFCHNKEDAKNYARECHITKNKVLAIFNPFITGGKWTEDDGLELLED